MKATAQNGWQLELLVALGNDWHAHNPHVDRFMPGNQIQNSGQPARH